MSQPWPEVNPRAGNVGKAGIGCARPHAMPTHSPPFEVTTKKAGILR